MCSSAITSFAASTLLGIDVSHNNGPVDWRQVAAGGLAFAYAKATEGTGFVDPLFGTNWAAMKQAGLMRGAYHFFHPAKPVAAQADKFVSVVGHLAGRDLPPMLDLEETVPQNEWTGVTKAKRVALALDWLERVEKALGRKPIVYTRSGFVQEAFDRAGPLAEYVLWIAHYTSAPAPAIPPGWSAWTIWQFTETGRVSGVKGNVDMNRFNGTHEELLALSGTAAEGAQP